MRKVVRCLVIGCLLPVFLNAMEIGVNPAVDVPGTRSGLYSSETFKVIEDLIEAEGGGFIPGIDALKDLPQSELYARYQAHVNNHRYMARLLWCKNFRLGTAAYCANPEDLFGEIVDPRVKLLLWERLLRDKELLDDDGNPIDDAVRGAVLNQFLETLTPAQAEVGVGNITIFFIFLQNTQHLREEHVGLILDGFVHYGYVPSYEQLLCLLPHTASSGGIERAAHAVTRVAGPVAALGTGLLAGPAVAAGALVAEGVALALGVGVAVTAEVATILTTAQAIQLAVNEKLCTRFLKQVLFRQVGRLIARDHAIAADRNNIQNLLTTLAITRADQDLLEVLIAAPEFRPAVFADHEVFLDMMLDRGHGKLTMFLGQVGDGIGTAFRSLFITQPREPAAKDTKLANRRVLRWGAAQLHDGTPFWEALLQHNHAAITPGQLGHRLWWRLFYELHHAGQQRETTGVQLTVLAERLTALLRSPHFNPSWIDSSAPRTGIPPFKVSDAIPNDCIDPDASIERVFKKLAKKEKSYSTLVCRTVLQALYNGGIPLSQARIQLLPPKLRGLAASIWMPMLIGERGVPALWTEAMGYADGNDLAPLYALLRATPFNEEYLLADQERITRVLALRPCLQDLVDSDGRFWADLLLDNNPQPQTIIDLYTLALSQNNREILAHIVASDAFAVFFAHPEQQVAFFGSLMRSAVPQETVDFVLEHLRDRERRPVLNTLYEVAALGAAGAGSPRRGHQSIILQFMQGAWFADLVAAANAEAQWQFLHNALQRADVAKVRALLASPSFDRGDVLVNEDRVHQVLTFLELPLAEQQDDAGRPYYEWALDEYANSQTMAHVWRRALSDGDHAAVTHIATTQNLRAVVQQEGEQNLFRLCAHASGTTDFIVWALEQLRSNALVPTPGQVALVRQLPTTTTHRRTVLNYIFTICRDQFLAQGAAAHEEAMRYLVAYEPAAGVSVRDRVSEVLGATTFNTNELLLNGRPPLAWLTDPAMGVDEERATMMGGVLLAHGARLDWRDAMGSSALYLGREWPQFTALLTAFNDAPDRVYPQGAALFAQLSEWFEQLAAPAAGAGQSGDRPLPAQAILLDVEPGLDVRGMLAAFCAQRGAGMVVFGQEAPELRGRERRERAAINSIRALFTVGAAAARPQGVVLFINNLELQVPPFELVAPEKRREIDEAIAELRDGLRDIAGTPIILVATTSNLDQLHADARACFGGGRPHHFGVPSDADRTVMLQRSMAALPRLRATTPERQRLCARSHGWTQQDIDAFFAAVAQRAGGESTAFEEHMTPVFAEHTRRRAEIRNGGAHVGAPRLDDTPLAGGFAAYPGWHPGALDRLQRFCEGVNTGTMPRAKRILLWGQPGLGKTWLLRALKNEIRTMNCYIKDARTTPAEEMIAWLTERFKEGQDGRGVVICIDEVDMITQPDNRVGRHLGGLMEGLGPADNVAVIGTANEPWKMDIRELSRFRQKCYVGLPDAVQRANIFAYYLRQAGIVDPATGIDELVEATRNFTPRSIAGLFEDAPGATPNDLLEAARERVFDQEIENQAYRDGTPQVWRRN